MRTLLNAVHRLGQFFTNIFAARIPLSVWMDSATLHLYRTRL
jgi:hypothetical protein